MGGLKGIVPGQGNVAINMQFIAKLYNAQVMYIYPLRFALAAYIFNYAINNCIVGLIHNACYRLACKLNAHINNNAAKNNGNYII